MVKIRLTRMGDKKSPFYRIVVADARYPRDGKFIDQVGSYDPISTPAQIKLEEDKIKKWLSQGAQPTDTVRSMLINAGVMIGKKAPAKTNAIKKDKKS